MCLQHEDTFKPILATPRVILELNPFGILIRRAILTGKPMVPCVSKIPKSLRQCNTQPFYWDIRSIEIRPAEETLKERKRDK